VPFGHEEPEDDATSFGFIDELGFADGAGEGPGGDPHMWRIAALVAATCVVAVVAALLLLTQGGGGGNNRDVSLPIVTDGVSTPAAVGTSGFGYLPTPTQSGRPVRHPRTSAKPSWTRTTTHAAASATTSARPTRQPTTPHTTAPRSTSAAPSSTSAAPQPSVQLGRGARDFRCSPHCYSLAVTLTNLPGGHQIVCEAQTPGQPGIRVFGSYDSTQDASCSYNVRGDTVWVVVDSRYYSNKITW
jgi:hypothetical protein